MKTAVVMSTYNGEKYIIEQLKTIRLQTISADEVIISDDGSSDSTSELIRDYIGRNNLGNWYFSVNEKNLGWKKNFYKLIDECDADLIFLADQDDIWNKKKLELMIPAFENKNVNILACDWDMKSSELDLNYKARNCHKISRISFSEKFMWVGYPGCAYCVRKSYFNIIKEWWRDWMPHDAFLFRNAMLDGSLYRIKSNLIIHRMHGNNAGTPKNFTQPKDDLNYYKNVLALLNERAMKEKEKKEMPFTILSKAAVWFALREKYYNTKSFLDFLRLFKYRKFYPYFKTYIKELFVANSK